MVNSKYKTLNVLLNAYSLGALAFVTNLEPYSKYSKEGIMVLCDKFEWYDEILKYSENKNLAQEIIEANAEICRKTFF